MDSKTLKNTLKQAKEAIKNKEIDSALKLCKAVLKEDRDNYIGLVLLGAALQESDQKDQAPNAFRKAIELSPDQLLAWQGLAAFYEKNGSDEHSEQLASIYQRLLHLESDSSKWCEIIFKIQGLITKFKSDSVMAEIFEAFKDAKDNEKLDSLHKLVLHYLSHVDMIPDQYMEMYEEVLNQSSKSENHQNEVYIKILYNQKKTNKLLDFAAKIVESNSGDVNMLEWICKVCGEQFVENRFKILDWCAKLPQYYNRLLEYNRESALGLMAQGVYQMKQHSFVEARDSLQNCLSVDPGLFHALCLLSETHAQLLCVDQALHWAKIAHGLRAGHTAVKAILAKALSLSDRSEDWDRVVTLSLQVLEKESSELALEALCEAYLRLGSWKDLLTTAETMQHQNPELAAFLRLRCDTAQDKQQEYDLIMKNTPNCPQAWYYLGSLHLQHNNLDQACTSFLKCAKQAPHWYTVYLQLGHIYRKNVETLDKAKRCFQRALVLNPSHVPTQMVLSDTYRSLNDVKNNLLLLEEITKQPEGRWAWPRLGLLYSDLGDTSSAISCLRSALKSNPDNSHIWEALADAYLLRGSNGAALKSYQKVLELKPGSFYPALQIATIKQVTDEPHESLLEFRELVELQTTSVLALKGLCETCICLAKDFISRRLLGLARDRLQEGLTAVSRALQERPDVACLWKLAGDCTTMAGSLPSSWAFLSVPEMFSPSSQCLRKLQLLELGARCFCRCLKLMSEVNKAMVWHNLAFNYRLQVGMSSRQENAKALAQKSLAAAKESIISDQLNWQHWNLLGVVAALPEVKNYSLAQHAFIKASMVDESVAIPWANLGCLYLCVDELPLANAAFGGAQRIDPDYCISWIGQALIAEKVGSEDTMDLFRHTTQLGYHAESCLGYAQWVCHTLKHAEAKNSSHYVYYMKKMHAVTVATDALIWATDEDEKNACGLNMLGCLLERNKLYTTAIQVLSRAVDHCPQPHCDKVLANFARVLLKAGKIEDSIKVYKAISKADIYTQCGLALALYKGNQYDEACEAYEAALNWWATDDSVKAHLHVALAAVFYKMGNLDKAKTTLLQGNQLKPQSLHGLFAACSLGMLNNDLELSKHTLKDMLKHQNDSRYITHISLFLAYIKFIQEDSKGSVVSMTSRVHCQPWQAELWLHLATLILHKQSHLPDPPYKVMCAARFAQRAFTLGHSYMDISKVRAVISLSRLLGGDAHTALSASQHAIHLFPSLGENWAVLAASCYAAHRSVQLRPIISHARQNTDLERPLAKWMSIFERKIAISSQ